MDWFIQWLGPAHVYWLFITVFTVAICSISLFGENENGHRKAIVISLVALAALGATAGILGGLSRVGVAGQIVAAVLSLIGGAGIVLLSLPDRKPDVRAAIATIALVVSLFLGFIGGAQLREPSDLMALWTEKCIEIVLTKDLTQDPFLMGNFGEICGHAVGQNLRRLGLR